MIRSVIQTSDPKKIATNTMTPQWKF